MEAILAVLRPKSNSPRGEYRSRLYDILLLETKAPHAEKGKPQRYLPMATIRHGEEEGREKVLTQVQLITRGESGQGIKGERALLIAPSDSRFSLYCVPVNQHEKLSKRHTDPGHNNPGFFSLESVIEMVNNGTGGFPSQTRSILLQLESWLREKHSRPGAVEAVFRKRAEFRVRLTILNPVFLPSCVSPDDGSPESMGKYAEIQMTANEARAKMLSIEKCDISVINPLFGSGLPYKTKVNRHIENNFWPQKPDYTKVVIPTPPPEVPRWREKYPVHSKAAEGDLKGVKDLLHQGQFHSKKDSISWAPIHYAAWFGYPEVVSALLDAGCSPNIPDFDECTALHIAARKGHPSVAEVLLLHRETDYCGGLHASMTLRAKPAGAYMLLVGAPKLDRLKGRGLTKIARDKKGKTPMDMCSGPDHTDKHDKIADYIRAARLRPRPEIISPVVNTMTRTIAVVTMDSNTVHLTLTKGYDTSVKQLNEQMLNEFGMPAVPYAQIFTIWICSKSLELQLKLEHKAINQLDTWQIRTVGMLSEADPLHEEPVLKWRRNAKIGVETEKQLTHHKALDLLFHEAYYNYISALYPCKEQDAVAFAAILFSLWYGHLDSSAAKSFLSNSKNLQDLVPQPLFVNKGATQWASKILRECRDIGQRDRSPWALKKQFMSRCHILTVYGSAFFTGSLQGHHQGGRGSGSVKCHIGINDVGIHLISAQNKSMLQSYKYSEIEWKHDLDNSILEVHVTRPEGRSSRNSPKTVTKIRSKQAGLIRYLMNKLAQINGNDM